MYQFRMNVDLNSLKKQLDDMAEVRDFILYEGRDEYDKSLEGVLGLLGAILDQIEEFESARSAPPEPRLMTNRLAVGLCEGFEEPEDEEEVTRAWQCCMFPAGLLGVCEVLDEKFREKTSP